MVKNNYIIIALDGAAGSGKSTTARKLCEKFNYIHVDTGLHYRSICKFFLNKNISADLVRSYLKVNQLKFSSYLDGFSLYLGINGSCFKSHELRIQDMNKEVSYFARLPEIRSLLLTYQRSLCNFGKDHDFSGIIMDGRDIGSVVLPDAHIKIFLHANLIIRQNRRTNDGEIDSISSRDQLDSTRKVAPLVCPEGALSIDTGIHSINDVLSIISSEIKKSS